MCTDSFFDSLALILNGWYMLSRSCYIENDTKAIELLGHGCKCIFIINAELYVIEVSTSSSDDD